MNGCPYCDFEAPDDDVQAEVAHMEAAHRDVIEGRLAAAGMLDPRVGFHPAPDPALAPAERVENALLKLMGYRQVSGWWLDPQGARLDGARDEALQEACATVEIDAALVEAVQELVAEGIETATDGCA